MKRLPSIKTANGKLYAGGRLIGTLVAIEFTNRAREITGPGDKWTLFQSSNEVAVMLHVEKPQPKKKKKRRRKP
jgi:hypothetical protein